MQSFIRQAAIVLGHHERFNGEGYPNRLAGEDIPLACRIVAVIDCFDALFLVRWVLDEASPHPEGRCWLGKPPEAGLWKRFR